MSRVDLQSSGEPELTNAHIIPTVLKHCTLLIIFSDYILYVKNTEYGEVSNYYPSSLLTCLNVNVTINNMRKHDKGFTFKQLFIDLTTSKAIVIILILGLIVFGNALFNSFVWDDLSFVLNPPYGHTLNLAQLFGPNYFNEWSFYRPIPAFYFALIYAIANTHAFFYHFIQIVLHITNAILVFVLFRSLLQLKKTKNIKDIKKEQLYFQSLSGSQQVKYMREHGYPGKTEKIAETDTTQANIFSLVLSLIFLIHPINVESVSYIAASQSELFFLFGIIALVISSKKEIHLRNLFVISGLTLLSLLTKETGFLFLLMILFFQLFFYKERFSKFSLFECVSFIVYLFFRFTIGKVFFTRPIFDEPIPIAHLSLLERLVNIPAIFLYYLQTFFWPVKLAVLQNWVITGITFQSFYLPLFLDCIFFCITCLGGVYLYKRQQYYFRVYTFFFLWFYLGMGMLLQIFPLELTVADRWFYFPIIGLLGMLGTWIYTLLLSESLKEKYKTIGVYSAVCVIIIIVLLSVRTIVRNIDYHDDLTLALHDAQVQDNAGLESTIGVDLGNQGNIQAAYPHLQKSVSLDPFVSNLMELGVYYDLTGNEKEAKEYYFKALAASQTASKDGYSDKNVLLTYVKLANLLMRYNDYNEAVSVSKMGIKHYPHSASTATLQNDIAISEEALSKSKSASASANFSSKTNAHENPQNVIINGQKYNLTPLLNSLFKNHH